MSIFYLVFKKIIRLDRIDEAIEIYVTKVGDISLAEECCLSRESSKQPEAFLALVRAILKTENGTKKAIAIMEKYFFLIIFNYFYFYWF